MENIKPNDKVKIKDNLIVGKTYDMWTPFLEEMAKYRGKVMTVEDYSEYDGYYLKEDDKGFNWSYDMLEKVRR